MRSRAFAVVLLLAGGAGAQEPRASRVELAARGFDFALDPDTGGLAVVVPDEDRVLLYPKFAATQGTTPPVTARVGRMPLAAMSLTWKEMTRRPNFWIMRLT